MSVYPEQEVEAIMTSYTPSHAHIVLVLDPVAEPDSDVAMAMSAAGYVVEHCQRSEEAIASLAQARFDLVVSTLVDGDVASEFGDWLAQRYPLVPLVKVAPADGTRSEQLDRTGTAAVLEHPLTVDSIREAVSQALGQVELRQLAHRRQQDLYVNGRQEIALSAMLDQALQSMYMVYQPVIRARTNCVVGYEALLRTTMGRFPRAGPVLAVAKRLGRTKEVDLRVRTLLAREFERGEQWRTFFINLDIGELTGGTIGTDLDPLRPYASRIVCEFSQDFSIPLEPEVLSTIDRIRDCGYRIAAGNINSTTASLVRMRVLTPDTYKLGVSVIRRCEQSSLKQRCISEVVEMAHAEGALVVAQGIERTEELRAVVELGCDLTQGFLLGIPRAVID